MLYNSISHQIIHQDFQVITQENTPFHSESKLVDLTKPMYIFFHASSQDLLSKSKGNLWLIFIACIIIMRYNTLRNQLKWNATNQPNIFALNNKKQSNSKSSELVQPQKYDFLEYMWLQKMVNDMQQYKENVNKKPVKMEEQQQKGIKMVLKQKCLNTKVFINKKSQLKQKSQQNRSGNNGKKIKFQIIVHRKAENRKSNTFSLTQKKKNVEQTQKERSKIKQNNKQIKCRSLPKKIQHFIASTQAQQRKQKSTKKTIIKLDEMITETLLNAESDIVNTLWASSNYQTNNKKISYDQSQKENMFLEKKKSIGKIIRNNDRLNITLDEKKNLNRSKIINIRKIQDYEQLRVLKKPERVIINLQTQKLSQYLGDSALYRSIKQQKRLQYERKDTETNNQNPNVNELSIIDRVDTVYFLSNQTSFINSKQILREEEEEIKVSTKKQQRKLNRSVTKQKIQQSNSAIKQQVLLLNKKYDIQPEVIDFSQKSSTFQSKQMIKRSRQKLFTLNSLSSGQSPQKLHEYLSPQSPQLYIHLEEQILQQKEKSLSKPTQHIEKINLTALLFQGYYRQELSYIFNFLDEKKEGKLYNTNCLYRQLTYELKILLNNIIDNIFTKRTVYSLQQFIKQTKAGIVNVQTCLFLQEKAKTDDIFKNSLEILKYKSQLMKQMDSSYQKLAVKAKQDQE